MRQYGKIIAQLRKEYNMTQAELGAKLNVTYQAVSKWENDQSQPDFSTMAQIAELFHVPLTIFLGEDAPEAALAAESGEGVLGYCTVCGNAVRKDNVAQQRPVLICKDCVEADARRKEEEARAAEEIAARVKAEEEKSREEQKHAFRKIRNIGLISAGVITALLFIFLLIGMLQSEEDVGTKAGIMIVFTICPFTFISQMLWHRHLRNMCMAFKKESGEWTLFSFVIFIVTLPFMIVFTFIISPFTFIPAVIRIGRYGPVLSDEEEQRLLNEAEEDEQAQSLKNLKSEIRNADKEIRRTKKELRDLKKSSGDGNGQSET
mgnify:CR=1 FL=1